jgi:hypothetical protein
VSPDVRTVEGAGGADQQCAAADHVLATGTCGDALVAYRLLGLEQAAPSKSRLTPTPSSPPTPTHDLRAALQRIQHDPSTH